MTRGADEIQADGLKKGPWTPDEDEKLVAYIQQHGHGSWRSLPLNAGLQRCGKSCRLRWTNYLRPDIKRGRFSPDEDHRIVHLHAILGNRWSAIASHLPRRTDNEIKNYWNTHLKKRLRQMGIDPVTHTSTTEEQLVLDSIIPGLRPVLSSNLTHMSQWHSFRAEAEARLSGATSGATSGTSSHSQTQTSSQLMNDLNSAKTGTTTPNQGFSASTTFMSSWKTQVAETLQPSFGMVELDKTPSNPGSDPVNLQTFLQNWDSSLQVPVGQACYSNSRGELTFSAYGSPIDVPDLSSDTPPQLYDAQGSNQQHLFPPSTLFPPTRIPGDKFSLSRVDSDSQSLSTFSLAGICGDSEAQFSPTRSTLLHAHCSESHDSSSHTNRPCGSSTNSWMPNNLVFPQGADSFWCRQQVAMADALHPEPRLSFIDRGCTVPMLNPFFAFGTQ